MLITLSRAIALAVVLQTAPASSDTSTPNGSDTSTGEEASTADNIPAVNPPFADVTCEVAEPKAHELYLQGAPQGSPQILQVSVDDCRYSKSITGVVSISVEFELDFELDADVNFCQGMRVAQLLEISAVTPGFPWPRQRVLIDELSVSNLSDTTQDIAAFQLHKQLSSVPTPMRAIFAQNEFSPNYNNLFWARVIVFEETEGASFSRLLNSKLPPEAVDPGKPDYELALSVTVKEPRGVCRYEEEVDIDGKKQRRTKFMPLTDQPPK